MARASFHAAQNIEIHVTAGMLYTNQEWAVSNALHAARNGVGQRWRITGKMRRCSGLHGPRASRSGQRGGDGTSDG